MSPAVETVVENPTAAIEPSLEASLMRRIIMASLGLLFVGIAAAGVFLPGVPTVGPLILASIFLTKSSPRLERKLIRNRFFARYLHYLDGTSEMPRRAKLTSIVLMWTSLLISSIVLRLSAGGPYWLLAALFLAGIVGTVFIIRYGKRNPITTPWV